MSLWDRAGKLLDVYGLFKALREYWQAPIAETEQAWRDEREARRWMAAKGVSRSAIRL